MLYDLQTAMNMKNQYQAELYNYQKMFNYYIGKTDIISTYPKHEGYSNRIITSNFIKAFIDEEVAYMTGKPITYSSRNSNLEEVRDIYYHFNNLPIKIDNETALNMNIFGTSYELSYLYNGIFKVKSFSPLDSYAYLNMEDEVEMFMYFYKKDKASGDTATYIELIDDEYIYHFDDSFNQIAQPTRHYFGKVPVGVAMLHNGRYDSMAYSLKSKQDAYEFALSDMTNEISDTRMSYMYITGKELKKEDIDTIAEHRLINISESNAQIGFAVKNISSDYTKEHLERIRKDLYKDAQHIDNQEEMVSNTTGTALQTRINCLRIKLDNNSLALKNCIKKRIECLFTYLKIVESKNYDYKDVQIQIQLDIPKNDQEISQIISQMNGKLSTRTGLSQLSFITDADAEFNKLLEEQKMIQDATLPPNAYDEDADRSNEDDINED